MATKKRKKRSAKRNPTKKRAATRHKRKRAHNPKKRSHARRPRGTRVRRAHAANPRKKRRHAKRHAVSNPRKKRRHGRRRSHNPALPIWAASGLAAVLGLAGYAVSNAGSFALTQRLDPSLETLQRNRYIAGGLVTVGGVALAALSKGSVTQAVIGAGIAAGGLASLVGTQTSLAIGKVIDKPAEAKKIGAVFDGGRQEFLDGVYQGGRQELMNGVYQGGRQELMNGVSNDWTAAGYGAAGYY